MGRSWLIWGGLAVAIAAPLVLAATSPLLAWRDPIYIIAGFAGVLALGLMLAQPLLVVGHLPGISGRRWHRRVGAALLTLVVLHVGGLWITSPPDVVDALLLRSPTPFSVWGVLAMWAVFASAGLALVRKSLGLRAWRLVHTGLAGVIVAGTALHGLLIEGTMETVSKTALSVLVIAAFAKAVLELRVWAVLRRR